MRRILRAITFLVFLLLVTASAQNTLSAAHANSSIYWPGGFRLPWGTIAVANVDGSGDELLNPYSFGMLIDYDSKIVVDHPGGKIYWPNHGTGTVHRANLDGSGEEELGLPIHYSARFTLLNEAPPVSDWGGASVVGMQPTSSSTGLNWLIALLIPLGAVLLWKGFRKRQVRGDETELSRRKQTDQ